MTGRRAGAAAFLRDRRNLLKLALIALGALPCWKPYAGTLLSSVHALAAGKVGNAALTWAVLGLSTAATLLLGWARPAPARWAAAALLGASTAVCTGLFHTGQMRASFETVAMLIDSRAAAPQFAATFVRPAALSALAGVLTLLGVGLQPPRRWTSRLAVPAAVALFATLLGYGATRGLGPLKSLAPGWSVTTLATMVAADRAINGDNPPLPTLRRLGPVPTGDIVLVVDESINAHYLDINRPRGVRSGLAEPRPGVATTNFGIAAAATNFSTGTNFILRTGGTRQRWLQRQGSIWDYAHRAGLRTVFIYAQDQQGVQNMMNGPERAEIDDYILLGPLPRVERDARAATLLRARLDNGVRELIYINKLGAHFPAWQSYPADRATYGPTIDAHGPVPLLNFGAADNARRYRNDYRNAVAWTVGGFFDRVLARPIPAGTTIIYTSDHGESLGERGPGWPFTHANADKPTPEEGAVPLVVLSAPGDAQRWRVAAARGVGASHYRIFPTLVALMGYGGEAVHRRFGEPLWSATPDPMIFNSHFYARFGVRPSWHRVDPRAIVEPPAGDYDPIATGRRPARQRAANTSASGSAMVRTTSTAASYGDQGQPGIR